MDVKKRSANISKLLKQNACNDGFKWASKYFKNPQLGWNRCCRPDWMLFFLQNLPRYENILSLKYDLTDYMGLSKNFTAFELRRVSLANRRKICAFIRHYIDVNWETLTVERKKTR